MMELSYALKYVRKHMRQFFTVILSIAMLTSSLITIWVLQGTVEHTLRQIRYDSVGRCTKLAFDIEMERVSDDLLEESNTGLVTYIGGISAGTAENYIGTMSMRAAEIANLMIRDGQMPKNSDEAAVEYRTYLDLKLTAQIGEKFSIEYTDENGDGIVKEFTLTGVLYDYRDSFSQILISKDYHLPGVLTICDTDNTMGGMILYGEEYENKEISIPHRFGGQLYGTTVVIQDSNEEETNKTITAIVAVATIVFAVIIFFGVISITNITFENQNKNMSLLRKIGTTPKQTLKIYFYEGLVVTLLSVIGSILIGSAFVYIAVIALNFFGVELEFCLPTKSYIIATLICIVTISISYFVNAISFISKDKSTDNFKYKTIKVDINSINTKRRYKKLKVLLKPAIVAKSAGLIFNSVMIALCIGCIASSYVYGYALASDMFTDASLSRHTIDYCYRISGGSTYKTALSTNIDRGAGVSVENSELIHHLDGVSVTAEMIYLYDSSKILIESKDNLPENFQKLYDDYNFATANQISQEEAQDIQTNAGYDAEDALLCYDIRGMDFEYVENLLLDCLVSGKTEKSGYESGKEVIAFGDDFSVGDTFTISIAKYDPDVLKYKLDLQENKPIITNHTVTVTSVYDTEMISDEDTKELLTNLYLFSNDGKSPQSCIFMSADIMRQADDTLGYEVVLIKKNDGISESDCDMINKTLEEIYQDSHKTDFTNNTTIDEQIAEYSAQYMLPFVVIAVLIVFIIAASFYASTSARVRSSVQTWAILESLGMPKKSIRSLIIRHNLNSCIIGILLGLIGFAVFCKEFVSPTGIVDTSLCISTAVKSALLFGVPMILICLAATGLSFRWIDQKTICRNIGDVDY